MYVDDVDFNEDEFLRIFRNESMLAFANCSMPFRCSTINKLADKKSEQVFVDEIKRLVNRVYNRAYQTIVPRYVAVRSNNYVNINVPVPESIAAHTSVMTEMYLGFLDAFPNHHFSVSRDVFLEAIWCHDLPENKYGDIADKGSAEHDDGTKEEREIQFLVNYRNFTSRNRLDTYDNAMRLIESAREPRTLEGKSFLCCDKVSAIIPPLTVLNDYKTSYSAAASEEERKNLPAIHIAFDYSDTQELTARERNILKLIRNNRNPSEPVDSFEIYTADFLAERKLFVYDEFGYYTALIIAYTLAMRGEWYNWREKMYDKIKTP